MRSVLSARLIWTVVRNVIAKEGKAMRGLVKIESVKEEPEGTRMIVRMPGCNISDYILSHRICAGEMYIADNREISPEQRKKIYATIRDIANYTGYLPEECKEHLKYEWICQTGQQYISFSNCSMTIARDFISFLLEYSIREGVQLTGHLIERSDDVEKALWLCIKYRKCCICGRHGEVHHVDHIGMGYDRKTKDDSDHRKMCLCREHHTEAHTLGEESFCNKYHVFGVIFNEEGGGGAECEDTGKPDEQGTSKE